MSTLANKLKDLSDDDLLDVSNVIDRELKRRVPAKDPSAMDSAEFDRWSQNQIRAAQAAKQESDDGE